MLRSIASRLPWPKLTLPFDRGRIFQMVNRTPPPDPVEHIEVESADDSIWTIRQRVDVSNQDPESQTGGAGCIPSNCLAVELPTLSFVRERVFSLANCKYRKPRTDSTVTGVRGQPQLSPSPGNSIGEPTQIKLYPNPTFLQTYFDLMFKFGMSPIRGDGTFGNCWQMVMFAVILALSMLNTFGRCKIFVLSSAEQGNLTHYIFVWFLITLLMLQLYFIKLVTYGHAHISSILQNSVENKVGILLRQAEQEREAGTIIYWTLIILATASVTIGFDLLIAGETAEDIILQRSYNTGKLLFLWDTDQNQTKRRLIFAQFGAELSSHTFAMGVLGILMELFANLHEYVIRGIFLMAALHSHGLCQIMESCMQTLFSNNARPTVEMLKERHHILYPMAREIEDGLGMFIKLVHMNNVLYCAYVLLDLLRGNIAQMHILESMFIIPAIILAYSVAVKSVVKNQAVNNFIEDSYCENDPEGLKYRRIKPFLRRLKRYAIVVGRGYFVIDEAFMIWLTGLVISLFLLFKDAAEKSEPATS